MVKKTSFTWARPKRFLPKAWALTVDMNNKTLLGVAEFCTNKPGGNPGAATSTISNYMNPMTPPVATDLIVAPNLRNSERDLLGIGNNRLG
ncbi:hypothetical protein EJB05_13012, partial [Eragrostis curvula]